MGRSKKVERYLRFALDIISEKLGENKKLKKLTNVRNYMEL